MIKLHNKLIIFGFFIFAGCVPMNQFSNLQEKNSECETERKKLSVENEKLGVTNNELEAKIEVLEKKLATYENDSLTQGLGYASLKSKYDILKKQYESLNESQEALLSGSSEETTKLLTELHKAQNELQVKEDNLFKLEKSLNNRKRELDGLSGKLESKDKRLLELESILQKKDAAVNELKNRISNALMGFEGQGLTVTQKNGMVYVSLDEKLLFQSGSTEVDAKGKSALKKLAEVLVQNKDINILIEGHTDDVPLVANSRIKDNWDLSVMRATAIVRILMENPGIDPKRLIASGRGEYLPVEPAKTKEARQKNRRTEIILSPNLEDLYEILE